MAGFGCRRSGREWRRGTAVAEFGRGKICRCDERSWVGQSEIVGAPRDCCGGFAWEWRNGFGDHTSGRATSFAEERRRDGEQLDGAGFEGVERQQERHRDESGSVCRADVSEMGSAGIVWIFGAERADLARGIRKSERSRRGAAALADGRASG